MSKNVITKTKKAPMEGKVRKGFKAYVGIILCLTMLFVCGVTAFAADDPVAVVNNLSTFIFGLIRAVGLIILGFGIVQVGLSLKSHDPSQRANGFLTVAGGIVITFAKEILDLIVGQSEKNINNKNSKLSYEYTNRALFYLQKRNDIITLKMWNG